MSNDKTSNALSLLDQQLSQRAMDLRSQISSPSVSRLSIDDAGNFVGLDGLVIGPEVDLIVLDFISANRYYPKPYNPKNPEPPVCFAFGRKLDDMAPEAISPEIQSEVCKTCWANEWKSDARGVGKACKNTREVAVITHDQFDLPPEEQKILVYSVPPTGIKSFDGAVSYMIRTYNSIPIRNIFRATAVKETTYTTVSFTPTDEVNPFLEEHLQRVAECEELLIRMPDLSNYAPAPQKGPARPAARAPR